MTADALDQSWSRISPAAAKAAGIKLISGYLSHDLSKNWTAAQIRAYHAAGIGVLLNWESDSGRPLLGASAGSADAAVAVSLAKQLIAQVGYEPRSRLALVFSCDRDTTPSDYPAIDGYYRATLNRVVPDGFDNGAYGEFDVIEHLHAIGLTQVEWQTLAWSHGLISAAADLYQSSINNTLGGASVDLDQIRHATTVGAWWPPGSAQEQAAVDAANPQEVPLSAAEVADIKAHVDQQIAQVRADMSTLLQKVLDTRSRSVDNAAALARVEATTVATMNNAASANLALTDKQRGVVVALAALKQTLTGQIDLTAVTQAAHDGAAAGADLNGKTLTINTPGGTA